MKKFLFAVAIATTAALASCTTDPVHGTKPVTNAFYTDADGQENFPLDEFHKLGKKGKRNAQLQLVNQYRRQLTANVVRQYPKIRNERNIHFILGSGFAKDVQSGDGKTYSGKFKNELIIILDDPSVKDTIFLACGNGMLYPLEFKFLANFGTAEKWRFTILPGQGLAHHLPELKAWGKTANELSIPIKDKDGNIVSQEKYLNYLGNYESLLFPYDVVDILNGKVLNRRGQEVDFERRMEETKKANEAAAKAKAKKAKARRRR